MDIFFHNRRTLNSTKNEKISTPHEGLFRRSVRFVNFLYYFVGGLNYSVEIFCLLSMNFENYEIFSI